MSSEGRCQGRGQFHFLRLGQLPHFLDLDACAAFQYGGVAVGWSEAFAETARQEPVGVQNAPVELILAGAHAAPLGMADVQQDRGLVQRPGLAQHVFPAGSLEPGRIRVVVGSGGRLGIALLLLSEKLAGLVEGLR